MKWPFVSRRRYEQELDAVKADRERIRGERLQFAEDRDAFKRAAESASEKYTDACIAHECLAEELAALKKQLASSMDAESALARQIHELVQPVEPTDSEMDSINRLIQERDSEKKRADRLQEQLAEALAQAADSLVGQVRAQLKREKRRGDRLQKQYDDAVGMGAGRIEDSSRWRPGYKASDGVAS